jgi:hypothetical protein
VVAGRKKLGTTEGHPTDIRIGICRGLGLSRDDTAVMAGCSVPTVDLRKDEPVAQEWEEWASGLLAVPSMAAAAHMETQARKRVGKALHVIDRALDDENLDTAMRGSDRVLDRAFGRATQRVETTADITTRTVFELPESALEAIQAIAAATQPKRITGEVVEATVVKDTK